MRNDNAIAIAPPVTLEVRDPSETTARSVWWITLRRLYRSKTAMIGLAMLLLGDGLRDALDPRLKQ